MDNKEMLLEAMRSLLDNGEIVGFGATHIGDKLVAETQRGDVVVRAEADNAGVRIGAASFYSEEDIKSAILEKLYAAE